MTKNQNSTQIKVYFNVDSISSIMEEKTQLENVNEFKENMPKYMHYLYQKIKFSKFTRYKNGKGDYSFAWWSYASSDKKRVCFLFKYPQNARGIRMKNVFLKDLNTFVEERLDLGLSLEICVEYNRKT